MPSMMMGGYVPVRCEYVSTMAALAETVAVSIMYSRNAERSRNSSSSSSSSAESYLPV